MLRVLLSLCSALVGKCLETSIGEKFGHNYFERLWFMIVAFVVKWDPYDVQATISARYLNSVSSFKQPLHYATRVAFAVLSIWRKIPRK